jgi:hypothetical protein
MRAVLKAVGASIRAWGYRGSGQNYRGSAGDVIFVVNFQRSRSGGRFFVNFGAQPSSIPDEGERDPDPRTLKEYECVFRYRLPGDRSMTLSATEVASLIADLDGARQRFESKVAAMRELSRQGRARELFEGRAFMGPAARAALILGRLLAADGHAAGARELAGYAAANAGRARGLHAAAERLTASLPDI